MTQTQIDLDAQRYVKLGTTELRRASELSKETRERLEAGDELSVEGWCHVDCAWKCCCCGVWWESYFQGHSANEARQFECDCCADSACSDCIDEQGTCKGCNEAADERAYVRELRS